MDVEARELEATCGAEGHELDWRAINGITTKGSLTPR
jgi:hypothetical protein